MADSSSSAPAGGAPVPTPTPAAAAAAAAPPAEGDVLVQYVVMRGDLVKAHKWNAGGLIANGSHACVSVIMSNLSDPDVQSYVAPSAVTQMHKVVLSAKDESELTATSDTLTQHRLQHVLWTEQPENFKSCIAVKPYPRSIIQPLLRHLKLFR